MAISLAAVAIPAHAENPPKLSDPAATEYVQKLSDVLDDLLKAVKAKDETKTKELSGKFETLMKEGDVTIPKLPQEDQTTAGTWITGQLHRLIDAGWNPPS